MRYWLTVCVLLGVSMVYGANARAAHLVVCPQQAASPSIPDNVDRFVLAQMAAQKIPGATVIVTRNNRVIKTGTYGVSSVELCAPASPKTRFGIGSISKMFTAVAVMMLARDGKLALDNHIGPYFPEAGGAWNGVTIRELLTHTSGVRDYLINEPIHSPTLDFDRKQNISATDFVTQLSHQTTTFPAGSDYAYSNAGYVLLGLIVERTSGMKFRDFMQARVFRPLGMNDTGYLTPSQIIKNRALGYRTNDDGKLEPGSYVSDFYGTQGDTSMYTTAADMAKWTSALFGNKFLDASMRKEIWSPFQFADGTSTNYGFGWEIVDFRGMPVVTHNGSFIVGYSASVVHFVPRNETVFVASNLNNANMDAMAYGVVGRTDPTFHLLSAIVPPSHDPDPRRTKLVLQFLRDSAKPSTQVPVTPGFGRLLPFFRAFFGDRAGHLNTLAALACDDIRNSHLIRRGTPITQECYYRFPLLGDGFILATSFSADGRIADIEPAY